jgi:glucose/arabinose dehydrogenase
MLERTLRLRYVGVAVCVALAGAAYAQQQPDLGPRPVKVEDTPYTFDTAEQHGIKVSVVVRGLAHPFSFAFLPNGRSSISRTTSSARSSRTRTHRVAASPRSPCNAAS